METVAVLIMSSLYLEGTAYLIWRAFILLDPMA